MKFSAVLVGALAAQASAFSTQGRNAGGLKPLSAATLVTDETKSAAAPSSSDTEAMAGEIEKNWNVDIVKDSDRVMPGRYNDLEKSIALPFLDRPAALDGSHAGDYGFDPLGFSESLDFYAMQESEIRHARLAMLAVVGWPMSELLAPSWMLQHGCAPSVLNGFNPLSFLGAAAFLGAAGYFEYKTALRSQQETKFGKIHNEDMSAVWKYGVAGDYNFDPLNLYSSCGDDYKGRKGLRDVEISHGRVAMLGITYFAAWEALTGHAIVENNMLFHPNLVFPLLVAAYTGFTQIYEVSPLDQYPIELRYTSEGEMKLKRLQNGASDLFSKVAESTSESKDQFDEFDDQYSVVEAITSAPKKFESAIRSTYKYW